MGTQYGPYVMYILSQMMQKRQAAEQVRESQEQDGDEPFAFDEQAGKSGTFAAVLSGRI